eukprot:SAG11_NODE_20478_length_444_cov_1.063768_1_plen_70_part_10
MITPNSQLENQEKLGPGWLGRNILVHVLSIVHRIQCLTFYRTKFSTGVLRQVPVCWTLPGSVKFLPGSYH